jgi:hypothetical protein
MRLARYEKAGIFGLSGDCEPRYTAASAQALMRSSICKATAGPIARFTVSGYRGVARDVRTSLGFPHCAYVLDTRIGLRLPIGGSILLMIGMLFGMVWGSRSAGFV